MYLRPSIKSIEIKICDNCVHVKRKRTSEFDLICHSFVCAHPASMRLLAINYCQNLMGRLNYYFYGSNKLHDIHCNYCEICKGKSRYKVGLVYIYKLNLQWNFVVELVIWIYTLCKKSNKLSENMNLRAFLLTYQRLRTALPLLFDDPTLTYHEHIKVTDTISIIKYMCSPTRSNLCVYHNMW